MDIGSILILLGITALAGAFVARPLVERQPRDERPESRRLSGLQAELDRVLATIQELDMDSAMGKLAEGEYRIQRQSLVSRGAALLQERDQWMGAASGSSTDAAGSLDAYIEAQVALLRGKPVSASAGFCPQCGRPAQAGDRFCVHCGTALGLEETAG